MTRNRVRRSFTVEVKSRSRLASSVHEAPKSSSPPPSVLWAGTDLSRELARLAEAPVAIADRAPAQKVVEKIEARRVLPSLLAAEPITVEPAPAPVREPRLPRVRRVSERTKVQPKLDAVSAPANSAASRSRPLAGKTGDRASPVGPVLNAAPVAVLRTMKARRKVEPAPKAGERWKRRLPRACW